MKFLVAQIAIVACCFTLSNCGGAGGDGGEPTIRPKTLDGITLTLDNSARFEFVRNTGTSPAVSSGDEETGAFFYTSLVGNGNVKNYDNLNGDQSNVVYPLSVAIAKYTYRAINESAGVLTLTGTGNFSTFNLGNQIIANDSGAFLFSQTSPLSAPTLSNTVVIDLTFTSNGSSVSVGTVTLSLPDSAVVNTLDTVRILADAVLTTGGGIPENYNPPVDSTAPDSKIAPESFANLRMTATNTGIPDPAFDFSIQFVADSVQNNGSSAPTELGSGLLRVAGVAVDFALNYTWTRIPGTDTGTLVLSNIPAPNSTFNGSYTLSFAGTDNGTYAGGVDGDTPDANEVIGNFSMLGN